MYDNGVDYRLMGLCHDPTEYKSNTGTGVIGIVEKLIGGSANGKRPAPALVTTVIAVWPDYSGGLLPESSAD